MTQTEKGIANYFLEENEPSDLSLKNMASLLAVSEATLVRFAKKCGFKGYREFIFQYGNSLETKKTSENIAQSSLQSVLNCLFRILSDEKLQPASGKADCKCGQMISEADGYTSAELDQIRICGTGNAYHFMRVRSRYRGLF